MPGPKHTIEQFRERFDYDPETGLLWLKNAHCYGKGRRPAGTLRKEGYVYVTVGTRQYTAHRVAWALHFGEWPKGVIDHINGIGSDNRIANLRDVDVCTNMQNQRRPKSNNRTGFLGVSLYRRGSHSKRYKAVIGAAGVSRTVGYYATPEEAHAAYLEAKRKLHAGNTL